MPKEAEGHFNLEEDGTLARFQGMPWLVKHDHEKTVHVRSGDLPLRLYVHSEHNAAALGYLYYLNSHLYLPTDAVKVLVGIRPKS